MYSSTHFEDTVFDQLAPRRKFHARTAARGGLVTARLQDVLQFTTLRAADRECRIVQLADDPTMYRVNLHPRTAARLADFLQTDNPEIDLDFADSLLNYTPTPDLIHRSRVPLWVIQRLGPTSVAIKRIW